MKLQLTASVASPQDLQALITEIRDYARWLGHNAVKKQLKAGHVEPAPALSTAAKDTLRQWQTHEPESAKSLDALLATLADYSQNAPQLNITLAAPAGNGLKKELVGWCRANVAPDAMVSFDFNQTILGGMVVRYGSRLFDWSFRRQILSERTKFPEILRHV